MQKISDVISDFLNDIKETAIDIHESLRKNGIGNSTKPVFVAGLLIALSDKDFEHNFNDIKSFDLLVASIITSINKVLKTYIKKLLFTI